MISNLLAVIFLVFVVYLILRDLLRSLKWINNKVIKNSYLRRGVKSLLAILISALPIYISYFVVVNDDFHSHILKLENELRDLRAEVKNSEWQDTLHEIICLQNKKIPYKPDFTNPLSVAKYWFSSYKKTNVEIIKRTQIILSRKKEYLSKLILDELDLSDYDLQEEMKKIDRDENKYGILIGEKYIMKFGDKGLEFSKANFENSSLLRMKALYACFYEANFHFAKLGGSNLSWANLQFSRFDGADLNKSLLRNSILIEANLSKSNLKGADLSHSNLIGANLKDALNLGSAIFVGAIYNSKPVRSSHKSGYDSFVKSQCAEGREDDQFAIDKCIYQAKMNSYIEYKDMNLPATKFPENFDPKKHEMIDISEDYS